MCRIPWWQGKMQGISPIRPFSAEIRLENICEFSDLRTNSRISYAIEQGIHSPEQGIGSASWTGAGNLARGPRRSLGYTPSLRFAHRPSVDASKGEVQALAGMAR